MLKALVVFGFEFRKASWLHKVLCLLALFISSLMLLLIITSLLQAANVEDMIDRLAFVPAVSGLALKAFYVLAKFDKFNKLIDNFDETFVDANFLRKALKKAMLLAKVQFYPLTAVYLAGTLSSFFTHQQTVPMFMIQVSGREEEIFWIYKIIQDVGSCYSTYLFLILDLMPICLMMIIAEYLECLNEDFKSLKNPENKRESFIKLIQMHLKIKRLVK